MKPPKPQTVAQKIETYKSMLQFHEDNPRKKTLKAKLQKEIDYLELQEFAKKRECKLMSKAKIIELMKNSHSKKLEQDPTHQVITVKTEAEPQQLFIGSKRECEAFIKGTGLITLTIEKL